MALAETRSLKVKQLADAVHSTILAKEAFIAASEGKITIEVYPKGHGYDVKVTASSR